MSGTRNTGLDERFGSPLEASRRGAHRARPSALTTWLPAAGIAVVVAGVGFGVWSLVGGGLGPDPSATVVGAVQETTTPTTTTPPTSAASASPTSTPTQTPSQDVASSSAPPAPTVQVGATVLVLNGTKTSGLGAKATSKLKSAGWKMLTADNYPNKPFKNTTVFYSTPDQVATAQQVAADLGFDRVKQDSAVATLAITVVLGTDYSP
jgi:hypothetical protein